MAKSSKFVKAFNEVMRTYDTSGGDSTYQAVGAAFTKPVRMLKFKNDSNRDVTISYDGTNAHDIILSGDREIEDLCSNKTTDEGMYRKQTTQIYANSASGTGNLYIIAIYADET